jgi:hypothetical protein
LEDDSRLKEWEESTSLVGDWMNHARLMEVGGCKIVLEDGPDVCDSKTSAGHSDHGKEFTGIYAPGCSSLR